ncbi:MAG TPA: hypothetical protein VGD65_14320 [Chryseosolibacter sp.]
MKSPKVSITLVTAGLVIFLYLCNSHLNVPTFFLVGFLILLQTGFLWMVYTILKFGKPSKHTFDDKMYEDR